MPQPSHLYRSMGVEAGISTSVLDAALEARSRVLERNRAVEPILSLNHLAYVSNVEYQFLRSVASRHVVPYYTFYITKRDGSASRRISVPSRRLRAVQDFIHSRILSPLPSSNWSYSYTKSASIIACASQHLGARWLIKCDIKDFFPSIRESQVYRVFRSLGFGRLIAFEMARICTIPPEAPRPFAPELSENQKYTAISAYSYGSPDAGLPMGAPSSPLLSEQFMLACDQRLAALSKSRNLVFTRYADDLIFSTSERRFTRRDALRVVDDVRKIIREFRLHLNNDKLTIVPPGARKIVLGLIVNDKVLHLPRTFKSRVRRHYFYLLKYGPREHAERRTFSSPLILERHLRGRIAFARMVEPEYADRIQVLHDLVNWDAH